MMTGCVASEGNRRRPLIMSAWCGLVLMASGLDGLSGGRLQAQTDALEAGQRALAEGKRLQAVRLVREAVRARPELGSLLPQFQPVVSDYSIEFPLAELTPGGPQDEAYVAGLRESASELAREPAIEAIARLAREHRIVILNEAHDSPQHRAFGHLLAGALRKQGFDYLAVETLAGSQGKAGRVAFSYPTLRTGHYSAEPVFGDFLRQAARRGFRLVAYEIQADQRTADPSDLYGSIIERENAQADNLIRHVLKEDPAARVLVYVGYSHVTENWEQLPDGREVGWLAAQLRRKTGIDPLTIDQVGGSYNPKSRQLDPVFDLLHRARPITTPLVLRQGQGAWVTSDRYRGKVDLTVFHPPQAMVHGRPDWLSMNGYRRPVTVPNGRYFHGEALLLQAFLTAEARDGLPMDQVLIATAEGSSTFLLPPGEYTLQTQTEKGEVRPAGVLEVVK